MTNDKVFRILFCGLSIKLLVACTSSGSDSGGGPAGTTPISPAAYLAFVTKATNLGSAVGSFTNLFILNTTTKSVTLASPVVSGSGPNGYIYQLHLSGDARYVVFESDASNLVTGDTNGFYDVFQYDTVTNAVTRLSVSETRAQGDAESFRPRITADGRYVFFESEADNLVSGDTNNYDIFLKDRSTNALSILMLGQGGTRCSGVCANPEISKDGRYLSFSGSASNIVSGDTNAKSDVFFYDRQTSTAERVSVSSAGVQADDRSSWNQISDDGRYIAFGSNATNLVSGDTNGVADIFLRDRTNNTTTRISVSSTGVQSNAMTEEVSMSSDGKFLVFATMASTLVSNDTNNFADVFLHNSTTGETKRISIHSSGAQGTNHSYQPTISADGKWVSFITDANNLVDNDTEPTKHILIYDVANETLSVLKNAQGDAPNGDTEYPIFNPGNQ